MMGVTNISRVCPHHHCVPRAIVGHLLKCNSFLRTKGNYREPNVDISTCNSGTGPSLIGTFLTRTNPYFSRFSSQFRRASSLFIMSTKLAVGTSSSSSFPQRWCGMLNFFLTCILFSSLKDLLANHSRLKTDTCPFSQDISTPSSMLFTHLDEKGVQNLFLP